VSGTGIGLGTFSALSTSGYYLGDDANSLGIYGNSTYTINNVFLNPGVTWVTGDNVDLAVDIDNKLFWVRSTSSANWNGNSSNSPTTGVGGLSLSTLSGFNLSPGITIKATSDVAVANFSTPPTVTGFSPWWTGATVGNTGDYAVAYYGLYDGAREYGDGYTNGETASMMPNIGGVIQQRDADRGVIDHAMNIVGNPAFMVAQTPPTYPAYAQDNQVSNPPAYGGTTPTLPIGARMVLPKSFNVTSPGTHNSCAANSWCDPTFGLIFATAFQNYGAIITDRGGAGFVISVENSVTNPLFTTQTTARANDLNYILSQLQYVTSAYKNPH
jgi:hypothetical protein